jgi:Na+/H+ antiporter NhaD/arsenite permease-like protein
MHQRLGLVAGAVAIGLISPMPAYAAWQPDGRSMTWPWALPFAGLLLSIATGPLLFHGLWSRHYGKVAAGWAAVMLVPLGLVYGPLSALAGLIHALLADYVSFIVLLFALYTVSGGIVVTGNVRATAVTNTAMLGFGTLMASLVGTTGAAMIIIRPLIRANAERRHNGHVVVFFIILVCNVGGALTPLGDPPLFAGFLRGIDFFWPARNIWMQTALVAGLLLGTFLVLDLIRHGRDPLPAARPADPVRVQGAVNLALIAAIIATILLSASWKAGIGFSIMGTRIGLEEVMRNIALLVIAGLSLVMTADTHRQANCFTWEPIREVAKLFAGIFIAIVPVIAMLHAGRAGAFAWLFSVVTASDGSPNEVAYFWLTGLLSGFLDNVPTYLLFLQLAGDQPEHLMGPLAGTLASISMGAVYMGALSYVGNAPNFMVYAIAQERGVKMPHFFGYTLWTAGVLLPLFALLTLLPVSPILKWS